MNETQQKVVELLRRRGGKTDEEIARSIGVTVGYARRVRSQLQAIGAVRMTAETRFSQKGSPLVVWDLTR